MEVPDRYSRCAMWPDGNQNVIILFRSVDHIWNEGEVESRMLPLSTDPFVIRFPVSDWLSILPRRECSVIQSKRLAHIRNNLNLIRVRERYHSVASGNDLRQIGFRGDRDSVVMNHGFIIIHFMEQRWLSLTGICTTLNISHGHAVWLAKRGFLATIWGDGGKTWKKARFLDPTPEYAEKLKLGEALYGRLFPVPVDLDLAGLITIREVAEIMGWSIRYARQYAFKGKIKPAVRAGITDLYSIAEVRRVFWKRNGRSRAVSKQVAPFLVREIIDYFLRTTAEAEREVPTDAQFAEDDLLQKKLIRMSKMKSPDREAAFADFYRKVELARLAVHGEIK